MEYTFNIYFILNVKKRERGGYKYRLRGVCVCVRERERERERQTERERQRERERERERQRIIGNGSKSLSYTKVYPQTFIIRVHCDFINTGVHYGPLPIHCIIKYITVLIGQPFILYI